MEKFICPNCRTKVSYKELFIFKKNHQTICKKCYANLKPQKTLSFNTTFIMGLIVTVVPGYILMSYNLPVWIIFGIPFMLAILTILGVALYTYKTTEFEID